MHRFHMDSTQEASSTDASFIRARGFTLVELVTTLVIVGVFMAVVAPRMFETQPFSRRGYVDEVASALRYSQKIAVASECEVSVTINAAAYAANQRSSFANCINGSGPWTTPVRRGDGVTVSGAAPDGVQLDPAVVIVFNARGVVASGAPAVITSGPFTLSIAPSGTVTVQP